MSKNEDQLQSITDHLGELRRRIIWVLLSFVVALVISAVFAMDVFKWIQADLFQGYKLHIFSPADPLKVYMQIMFILSFIMTIPIIMYHLWQFVRPGLKPQEQRAALMYIPSAFFLFLLGISFGYFLLFPAMITFLVKLSSQMGLTAVYGVHDAFTFLFNVIFPVALFFELPVIVLFLTRIRILTPGILVKLRKISYFAFVVLAAVITPSPDVLSQIIVAIPMILLYEISLFLARRLHRKMEQEDSVIETEASMDT